MDKVYCADYIGMAVTFLYYEKVDSPDGECR